MALHWMWPVRAGDSSLSHLPLELGVLLGVELRSDLPDRADVLHLRPIPVGTLADDAGH